MRRVLSIVPIIVAFVFACSADELKLAKSALRDGLWQIARTHAEKATGDESRLVQLESLANEAKWDVVAERLKAWPESKGGAFDYYRAVVTGDVAKAVAYLKSSVSPFAPAEAKMMEAGICLKNGSPDEARKLWAEVIALTNVSERALAFAAVNLNGAAALKKAYASVHSPQLKRLTGLRYGLKLLESEKTSTEGVRLVRTIAKDAPDAPHAREAFIRLAEVANDAHRWQEAERFFHEIVETWPETVKFANVQMGRGWALLKLLRYDEALEAFSRAEKLSTNEQVKALAVLKSGDTLSEMDRGGDAMSRYREVLAKYPNTHVAEKLKNLVRIRELENQGRDYFRDYRFAEAQKTFAEVASADPSRRDRMAYYVVLCLYGQGFDESAGQKARQIAETTTNQLVRADATLWLAKFLYNRREWKESRRLFVAYAEMNGEMETSSEALLWASRAAFAENEFATSIQLVTRLIERFPTTAIRPQALLLQAESLVELARFDEAVLVLDGVSTSTANADDRLRAQILKADALFAMGADNPARYQAALEAYRAVRFGGALSVSGQLTISFKIARTLEKLKRRSEASDQYYTQVVLAYYEGREKGDRFDDEARADFSRAAFWLADEFEGQGNDSQAENILHLVVESDVPAATEAAKRLEKIAKKGRFL